MAHLSRRAFLQASAAPLLIAQEPGERPPRPPGVEVLNPRERVPLALIIDDSTCLVNLNLSFAKNTSDRSPSDISILAMEQILLRGIKRPTRGA